MLSPAETPSSGRHVRLVSLFTLIAMTVGTLAAPVLTASTAATAGADTPGSVTISGHGFGHGRGMGQYGALGYSRDQGKDAQWILDHFYSNTHAAPGQPTAPVSVWLKAQDGNALKVYSADPFTVQGITVNGTAQVSLDGDQWVLRTAPRGSNNCLSNWGAPVVLGQSALHITVSPTTDPVNDVWRMLGICGSDGSIRHYRGNLTILNNYTTRIVNSLAVDAYIRGVVPRESPSSWPAEALKAQAVAARSYSLSEGGENGNRFAFAKTCDDTQCQVYGAAGLNGVAQEAASSDAAVAATSGQVRRFGDGTLARTEFSSSTGGFTSGTPQCSACSFPTVEDTGDTVSPYHNWTTTIPTADIENAYGIGTFSGLSFTKRNGVGADGGRVLEMQVVGATKTVTTSGDSFAAKFNLRSNWFTSGSAAPGPEPTGSAWYIKNTVGPGPQDLLRHYGNPGDWRVIGDWTGSGKTGLGTFKDGYWYLRNTSTSGSADTSFRYGNPGDIPVVGDWNGDGIDTVGTFRDGTWYLRNSNTPGPADIVIRYGNPGDIPVVGDWSGAKHDSIGTFKDGYWYLRDPLSSGPASVSFRYGNPGDTPVAGDWNGDGIDTVGTVLRGIWYLRNTPRSGGSAEITPFGYGLTGDTYLVGDANGDKIDAPTVVRG